MLNLKNYIELQQVRFKNKFGYDIFVDKGIGSSVMIPSLLVQPFVENAINHGLLNSEKEGHLEIAFRKGAEENTVTCTITDDGIGREQSRLMAQDEERGPSYGDELVSDLVRIFNTYEQMNIEIKYTDIAPPLSGTRVEIIINNTAHGA